MSGSVLSTVAKAMSGEKSCALWPKASVIALRMIKATPKLANTIESASAFARMRLKTSQSTTTAEAPVIAMARSVASASEAETVSWLERGRQRRCERRQDPVEHQRGIGADGQQLRIGEIGEAQHVHDHRQADRTERYDGAGQDAVQQVLDHAVFRTASLWLADAHERARGSRSESMNLRRLLDHAAPTVCRRDRSRPPPDPPGSRRPARPSGCVPPPGCSSGPRR